MLTFLELYQTLLGFVFFKLYTDRSLVYPPPLDTTKDDTGAGVGAYSLQEANLKSIAPTGGKDITVNGKKVTAKDVRQTIKTISTSDEATTTEPEAAPSQPEEGVEEDLRVQDTVGLAREIVCELLVGPLVLPLAVRHPVLQHPSVCV